MSLGKMVAFTCLVMLSAIPLQSQWEVGALVGINVASISAPTASSSQSYKSRLGFGIGAVVDKALTDEIILHFEPMFLQKGANASNSVVDLKFIVNYLEIPIMVKYLFDINSTLVPYAMAGPSVGFLAGAKFKDDAGNTQDEKDNTNAIDFGLGFGGGVNIPHDNLTFFAETRYVLGLANINSEADESVVKTRGLLILIGVTIPVGQ